MNPATIAEPVEVLLGMWTRMDLKNHILDGGNANYLGMPTVNILNKAMLPLAINLVATCYYLMVTGGV